MDEKKCTKCNTIKPIEDFSFGRTKKCGYKSHCKECIKLYYHVTKDKRKVYYEANRERDIARYILYRKNNKEKIATYSKLYRAKNKDKFEAYEKMYRENNKEKIAEGNRKSYLKHKKKKIQHSTEYKRERLKTDVAYAIQCRLRSRVLTAIKRDYGEKAHKSMELLGCSMKQYKDYLKITMDETMTWDDFMKGEIHIDHIKPCSSFNLTDEDEQRKCFHWSNTQLLWEKDNLEKSDKLDWEK